MDCLVCLGWGSQGFIDYVTYVFCADLWNQARLSSHISAQNAFSIVGLNPQVD